MIKADGWWELTEVFSTLHPFLRGSQTPSTLGESTHRDRYSDFRVTEITTGNTQKWGVGERKGGEVFPSHLILFVLCNGFDFSRWLFYYGKINVI